MPSMIRLPTMQDERGLLSVMEKGTPFQIKRVFYTHGAPAGTVRGGHGHKKTWIALVAAAGTVEVSGLSASGSPWSFTLDDPSSCLVLEPGDWHKMFFPREGAVLLCVASEEYDPADYVHEAPHKHPGVTTT
jgi:hypothetical protein